MDPELRPSPLHRAARLAIVGAVSGLGPLRHPAAQAAGMLWYATRPRAERLRTARNHRRLDPLLDGRAARRMARRSYREYVLMISDGIWAETLSTQAVVRHVRVTGREHFDTAPDGAVVAVTHFGNWDMAASAALALGLPMTTVMAQIISPAFTAMVALSRQRKGLELYTPRQAARGLVRALQRGRFVALMADIPEAGPTVVVRYCGGDVRFSAVPARLAASLRRPILPVACWREGERWRVDVHPALPATEDDTGLMQQVAAALEPAVRAHPEQWYPFHEVYVSNGGAPDSR